MSQKINTKSALETKDIIRFNALLNELYRYNKQDVKEAILEGYGVETTKALTPIQLEGIIQGLEDEKAKRLAEVSPKIKKLRSKCLGLLTEIGINTADYAKVNAYVEQPRMLNGRRLYDLDEQELEAFAKKLFAVKGEVTRRIDEEKFWASAN